MVMYGDDVGSKVYPREQDLPLFDASCKEWVRLPLLHSVPLVSMASALGNMPSKKNKQDSCCGSYN